MCDSASLKIDWRSDWGDVIVVMAAEGDDQCVGTAGIMGSRSPDQPFGEKRVVIQQGGPPHGVFIQHMSSLCCKVQEKESLETEKRETIVSPSDGRPGWGAG